jgi:hypothetical protein
MGPFSRDRAENHSLENVLVFSFSELKLQKRKHFAGFATYSDFARNSDDDSGLTVDIERGHWRYHLSCDDRRQVDFYE